VTPREASVVKAAIDSARARGAWIRKPAKTEAGDPDLFVCYRGLFLAWECKRPGQNLRKRQVFELRRIALAGGRWTVIRSKADAEAALDAIDRELDYPGDR
jgi:hypothetical protein